MMFSNIKIFSLLFLFFINCDTASEVHEKNENKTEETELDASKKAVAIQVGASRTDQYLELLKNKSVALLVNQTSTIGEVHLVDTLLQSGVKVKKIFAPEHGFRGEADAGEQVNDGKDAKTNIPLISLYGKKKKPGEAELKGIDVVVFDIQDVGVRFYTYISTMSYVMEACAENGVQFIVLDRPNPNGHYVDGPVLEKDFASFIGLHPVPVVHGMTVGEYAQMVNGEGWLKNALECDLTVVPCANYNHQLPYELPVKPSPNLPNIRSIYLYPSLCFFEGTTVNVGRGTHQQFQVYGHPDYQGGDYEYVPQSLPGAKYPKFKGEKCFGYNLSSVDPTQIRNEAKLNLNYLINYYKTFPEKDEFFLKNNFFDKLAGSQKLRQQIMAGMNAEDIRATWQNELKLFMKTRAKYLIY